MLNNKWTVEIIWWLVSGIVCLIFLFPIWRYKIEFPFIFTNIYFIVCLITFCRWLFLWQITPYAWWKWLKLSLIFLMIPIVFYAVDSFSEYKGYLDEIGIQELVKNLDFPDQDNMAKYLRSEMVFFGTSAIISGILVPIRMIKSLWTQVNRNYV